MKTPRAAGIVFITVAMSLALAAQKQEAQGHRVHVPLDGKQIFRSYCAACHGANGKGQGPAASALRHAPPDLTQIARRHGGTFPRERVKAIIAGQEQSFAAHGSREMPVWGPVFHDVEWDQDLGEVRLDNITRFVESLQQK